MKITHNTYADTWLYIGLTTESVIFLGYGLYTCDILRSMITRLMLQEPTISETLL